MNNFLSVFLAASAGIASTCHARQIQLQQATATYSQTYYGDYSVDYAIGSNPGNLLGWAIYNGNEISGTTSPQTAVFETVSNISSPIRTELDLVLQFQHWNPQHLLGAFRFSVTSDSRSLFADGLNNNGDVDANWTVLTPGWLYSDSGTSFNVLPDGTIIATGLLPSRDNYYIRFQTDQQDITGIRIEALANAAFPTGGPGRQPQNGNFVLTGMALSASAVPEPATVSLFGLAALLVGARACLSCRHSKRT